MFSFFRKKNSGSNDSAEPSASPEAAGVDTPSAPATVEAAPPLIPEAEASAPASGTTTPPSDGATPAAASGALAWLKRTFRAESSETAPEETPPLVEIPARAAPAASDIAAPVQHHPAALAPSPAAVPAPVPAPQAAIKTAPEATVTAAAAPFLSPTPAAPDPIAEAAVARANWLDRLRSGLKKTGSGITTVFTGTRIDEALYEELEEALLLADTGVKATQFLLTDLKRRVKDAKATEVSAVRGLLADAIADLLRPLEKSLVIGKHLPTVIMVAGVNGAGKTTSIGKLTHHLAQEGASVLLAAADTFRAAAREQLGVWATRNTVEIIGQQGGDPAAVSFDAVTAGKARGRDVVLVDTAGRLPTQIHLMEELKKIRRVVQKADPSAPHEVLLVIDGNTGQNALAQVRAFDDALQLTGLIVTKLDGTAKGGVLAAIAQERPVPVYFVGVGESVLDLETFNAREFAQALLG